MTLQELIEKSYKITNEKGFWDKYNNILSSIPLYEEREYVKQLFITQKLMLIVSELGESLESIRINKFTPNTELHIENLSDEEFIKYFETNIKDTFEDEIADVFIRLGDLCGKFNIDVEKHIQLKQKYNITREKMHGKNF